MTFGMSLSSPMIGVKVKESPFLKLLVPAVTFFWLNICKSCPSSTTSMDSTTTGTKSLIVLVSFSSSPNGLIWQNVASTPVSSPLSMFTGGHVREKSSVNVYFEGEHAHGSCAVALPDIKESVTADTNKIQEDNAICLGLAIMYIFLFSRKQFVYCFKTTSCLSLIRHLERNMRNFDGVHRSQRLSRISFTYDLRLNLDSGSLRNSY